MATETTVRIKRNPYHGFEVWVYGNGELTRRTFGNNHELITVLTAECVDDETLRHAADLFDEFEWEQTFPLGVVYVGEAVCDMAADEPDCDCDMCVRGHNAVLVDEQLSDLRSVVRSQWWFTGAALVLIGVVAWFV